MSASPYLANLQILVEFGKCIYRNLFPGFKIENLREVTIALQVIKMEKNAASIVITIMHL